MMERSPYDPSPDEATARNKKRLQEELDRFHNNMAQIDSYLKQVDLSLEEVLQTEQQISSSQASHLEHDKNKKSHKSRPQRHWLRL